MDFNTLIVHYWVTSLAENVGVPHKFKSEYNQVIRDEIINKCLELGLQVMLTSNPEGIVTIQIDNGRFRQR